jgi:hypothetical protein
MVSQAHWNGQGVWPNLVGNACFYTRSQAIKNMGPTLSIFGLEIGPKLLINAKALISGY